MWSDLFQKLAAQKYGVTCTVLGAMRFQRAGKMKVRKSQNRLFFPPSNDKWEAGTLMDTIKCHPASANIFA